MTRKLINGLAKESRELVWFPERGLGFYPIDENTVAPYDAHYFARYRQQASSEIGLALNEARIDFVGKHIGREVLLDVGIGSGAFVKARSNTVGYDINPKAVSWLKQYRSFCNPYYQHTARAMSFWDSLEHILDIERIISRVKEWAFVSIPIFTSAEHCLHSKHFRKDEHYWYFTHEGLVRWFKEQGFQLIEYNDMETKIGREDIGTYAFKRA